MPIYEYKCGECNHQLETMQKLSDAPLKDCPVCNRPTLKRLISASGFQLKGSGWYATDFKNSGRKQEPKSDSAEKSPSEKSSEKSSSSESGDAAPAKKAHACGGGCTH
jgi:putative FmdB family regulatory protein